MTSATFMLLTVCCLLACAHGGAAKADYGYRKVLTSVREGIHTNAFEHHGEANGQRWSVRKQTLHGGKQEGVEIVTIDNGRMEIDIVATRGMGVLEARSGDVRLGWNSPIKDVVHPQYVNLDTRGGLGWLEGFNELMVRCGLEYAGGPGPDEFINNNGDPATMDLTLHGKIANIPASEVEVAVDAEPPHRIRVRGVVYENTFHGPKLKLVAEVSTVPGSESFEIYDQVTNESANEQELTLIYHTNFGAPVLDEGAQLHAAAKRITPFNAVAAKDLDGYARYAGPTPGYIERVYLIEPLAGEDGRTRAVLANAAEDMAATMSWSVEELPYLTQWKNTVAEGDGYVTGIEPGTGYPNNRSVERAAGRLPVLAGGQTRSFTVEIGLLRDADVQDALAEVKQLQNGQDVEFVGEPAN